MTIIRGEEQRDIPGIYDLNVVAFGRDAEARLVDNLRGNVYPYISLVICPDGVVVGHILFTPVTVGNSAVRAMGLGPIAVLPEHRGRRIGSDLIEEGLKRCRAGGVQAVFVLGDPGYYEKFGFKPAAELGIFWKTDEFAPYFFATELQEGALEGISGEVVFHPAFEGV